MCGIFGKIAAKKERLELSHFNVLGFANDERGGDSVGIFIDGELEIGVDTKKKYSDFFIDSELLKKTTNARIAIGHTRKASIGKINSTTAQPVCILDETGAVEFVLMHNGTIFNYLDLAKKHIPFMDVKDFTDTQVMAHIFYYCGYDVLKEYEGAGAFVIIDYRDMKDNNPLVLFFKGASLKYKYSKEIEEERPLYMTISKDQLWFSSLSKPLSALNYPLESLTIRSNTLVKVSFKNKLTLVCVHEYNRSSQFQYKSNYQYNNEYDYNYNSYHYGKVYGSKANNEKSKENKDNSIVSTKKSLANDLWIDIEYDYVKEKASLHKDGLYYVNSKKMHGPYKLNFYGYIQDERYSSVHDDLMYYFFEGRLLPNIEVYKVLCSAVEALGETIEQFSIKYPECIDKYSYIPVVQMPDNDEEVTFFEQEDFDTAYLFDGTFKTMFSFNSFSYVVNGGILKSRRLNVTAADIRREFELFGSGWSSEAVDFGEELKDMLSYIYNRDEE